ncbi:MAG: peptidoglycan DD-metalloendopeptidase family protein [Porticoccaceae bacterium]|nr:peptidoglycan DD-metalloendopeptidase family protein [Porticoccaceae bacterium]
MYSIEVRNLIQKIAAMMLPIVSKLLRLAGKLFQEFPKKNSIVALGIVIFLFTLLIWPKNLPTSVNQITEVIPITLVTEQIDNEGYGAELKWYAEKVSEGDNLSTVFMRANLTAQDVYQLSSSVGGKSLKNLFPGELFRFGTNSSNELTKIEYVKSPLETHIFVRQSDHYTSQVQIREPDILVSYREGVIQDSLYLSAKKANLPDKLIMEMANIFGWDIDFVFDIRPGDSFALTYEERFIEGEKLSVGSILAASFTNRKKTFNAVRYTDHQGVSNYFTPEGLSMRKAFLRTPLDIFRISSGFNLKRKHPIHKKIKAHRGVDYAAPRGTPVYAAGAGKVLNAGYSRANGNYVFIQHGQTYVTKYLHLNKKTVRKGQTVKQRQQIGTVGSTGYATGPHLHYEFLVNGVHRNPRTVKLPQAKPIPKNEKFAFNQAIKPVLAQLAEYQEKTRLAYLDNQVKPASEEY